MLERLSAEAFQDLPDSIPSHPTICRKIFGDLGDSIVKLSDRSASEICAYKFANAFGIRVPEVRGFWIPESSDPIDLFNEPDEGIGLAVKFLEGALRENHDELARCNPTELARILAFWAFNGHEWGEIFTRHNQLYLIDLEYIVPTFSTRSLILKSRNDREKNYKNLRRQKNIEAPGAIRDVSNEAKSLGICGPFCEALEAVRNLDVSEIDFQSELNPHPLAEEIAIFARRTLHDRQLKIEDFLAS